MEELRVNLHMHTRFSDGEGTHGDIIAAAQAAGVDVVIVTDHNVRVAGLDGYYGPRKKRVLLIVGEEIHDRTRQPQKNHLLAFGHQRELTGFAEAPQRLIDAVQAEGGLAFLAHPIDPAAPSVGEGDISWVDWDVQGYNGIELWNGFSEFKAYFKTYAHALWYILHPHYATRGPLPAALRLWDSLLSVTHPVVAIGGSDAHALEKRLGPWRKIIFPYRYHFRAVNTHLLLDTPRSGDAVHDRQLVLDALRRGHAFIGYDLPADTRGFRFSAHGREHQSIMGDRLPLKGGVTLQIHLPDIHGVTCRLLRDGQPLKTWTGQHTSTYTAMQPGVYRVEVYRRYAGRRRGWIFSNPIYLSD